MKTNLIELFEKAIAEVRNERIALQIEEKTLIDAYEILKERSKG